jgi:UDP-2,3-diacylglucosamine hydrolase
MKTPSNQRHDSTARGQRTLAPAAGPDERSAELLFISDLHLSSQRPALTRLFIDFLRHQALGAGALYILGDLFDVWIGDDDDPLPAVRQGLRALTDSGTACWIMQGNRDFLLGRRFARATGCRLLRDPWRLELDGEAILLTHGDRLCTDDIAYQRFRQRVRNPLVKQLFLWAPLARRQRIARDYRQRSAAAMADKPREIMDVNATAVRAQMRRFGVTRLIHGHTHRPGDHRLSLDGRPVLRQVLADWRDEQGEALVYRAGTWLREQVAPSPG